MWSVPGAWANAAARQPLHNVAASRARPIRPSSVPRGTMSTARDQRPGLLLGPDGDLETARFGQFECPRLPFGVVRLGIELQARCLGASGDLIDVLPGADVETHADALLPAAPLLPVVLAQPDADFAGAQHHALELALVFP